MSTPPAPRRILFFAEAVSLAHVGRPLTLAGSLPGNEWEVHFACGNAYQSFTEHSGFRVHTLRSVAPDIVLKRTALGLPLYTDEELIQYVAEDRELIAAVKPDLIVGDLRMSLSISARQMAVPYIAITNAYWSPYFDRWPFRSTDRPASTLFGGSLPEKTLDFVQKRILGTHVRGMNRVRKHFGLPPITDIRQLRTDADWVLYLDAPALVPTTHLPAQHRYLGPIQWSPDTPLPAWWDKLPTDRPVLYVTLGTTGKVTLLPDILEALSSLDMNILVATAGRLSLANLPENVWAADFLPGMLTAARADLVICNGGSATGYQALANGKPVIGICSNMDQYLTMDCIEAAGAGRHLLAANASGSAVRSTAADLLATPRYTLAAKRLASEFRNHDAPRLFPDAARKAMGDVTW